MDIKKIGVLGTGQMGTGIMQVFAQSDYDVIGVDSSQEMLDKSVKSIDKRLAGRVKKGKMSQEDKDGVMAHITTSMKMEDLSDCDLIEEAVPEDLDLKKDI